MWETQEKFLATVDIGYCTAAGAILYGGPPECARSVPIFRFLTRLLFHDTCTHDLISANLNYYFGPLLYSLWRSDAVCWLLLTLTTDAQWELVLQLRSTWAFEIVFPWLLAPTITHRALSHVQATGNKLILGYGTDNCAKDTSHFVVFHPLRFYKDTQTIVK